MIEHFGHEFHFDTPVRAILAMEDLLGRMETTLFLYPPPKSVAEDFAARIAALHEIADQLSRAETVESPKRLEAVWEENQDRVASLVMHAVSASALAAAEHNPPVPQDSPLPSLDILARSLASLGRRFDRLFAYDRFAPGLTASLPMEQLRTNVRQFDANIERLRRQTSSVHHRDAYEYINKMHTLFCRMLRERLG